MSFLNRRHHTDGNQAPRPPYRVNWSSPQAQGLLMWYPLIDVLSRAAGAISAIDYTGRNSGGTNVTADSSGWITTEFGDLAKIIDLASRDVIALPSNLFDLGIRRHATISCWYFPTDSGATNRHIFGDWDSSLGIAVRHNGSAELVGFVYPNNHRITTTTGPSTDNIWHHLAAVLDDANWHLYVDGKLVGTTTLGEDIGDSAETMHIGERGDGNPMNGRIKDFRINDRAFNAQEIFRMWHPETRWDLYQSVSRTIPFDTVAAAGGRIMSSLAAHGGLAGHGGIAGKGGGLAG